MPAFANILAVQEDVVRPIDQVVLLSVDHVVVHHREKDTVEKECAEEEALVENQTTTTASDMTHENDE